MSFPRKRESRFPTNFFAIASKFSGMIHTEKSNNIIISALMFKSKAEKIYIIGIEGAGTSALAQVYAGLGHKVLGSDNGDHFYGDVLKRKKIKVFPSYAKENLPKNMDWVVYSTSIKNDNPEIIEAKEKKLKLYSYPEALGELFNQKFGVAVCGTHGKTTTTAMLAQILKESEANPTAVVGSEVIQWKTNTLAGGGNYFIIEADEYQNKFQYYNPWAVVLTSVDWDHPDFFPNFQDYKDAFRNFTAKIPRHGFLVFCGDERNVIEAASGAKCEKISYGFSENSVYKIKICEPRIVNRSAKRKLQAFEIYRGNKSLGKFEIGLFGKHNILNAVAAVAAACKLGANLEKIKAAIKNFQGTARRFEYIGKRGGAILIDDYAHHPNEIKATLKAVKELYPRKNIITVFQPHSYSRTEALFSEFAQSFSGSSETIILDIYGSVRENSGIAHSKKLADLANRYDPGRVKYISSIGEAVKFLESKINNNDVVISMGAGDVWRVAKELKAAKKLAK